MKHHKFGNTSYNNLEKVDPLLVQVAEMALKICPIDFGISNLGGYRTAEEQNKLFKADKSTKDGYKKKSKHQSGRAIDVVAYSKGKVTWEEPYYFMIISSFFAAAQSLGVEIRSGADWDCDGEYLTDQKFQDICHLELK